MARTVRFEYISKCPHSDPHLTFRVLVDDVERAILTAKQADIQSGVVIDDYKDLAWGFLRSFIIKWFEENPGGPLTQLRTDLEAETWRV